MICLDSYLNSRLTLIVSMIVNKENNIVNDMCVYIIFDNFLMILLALSPFSPAPHTI